jgi:predicted component of type VI protein secretion system
LDAELSLMQRELEASVSLAEPRLQRLSYRDVVSSTDDSEQVFFAIKAPVGTKLGNIYKYAYVHTYTNTQTMDNILTH